MRLSLLVLFLCAAACNQRPRLPSPEQPLVPTPKQAFRRTPPAQAPVPALITPELQVARLDNGFTLYLVERSEARLVTLHYVSRRAGSDDVPSAAEYANLTANLMVELHAFSQLDPEVVQTVDGIGFAVQTLPDEVDNAVALLADAVIKPRFYRGGVVTFRDLWRRKYAPDAISPTVTAMRASIRWVLGPFRAAGRFAEEIQGSLERYDELRARVAHARIFAPADSALVIVGPIEPARTRALVERFFGGWTTATPPPVLPPRTRPPLPTATVHGLRADITQAQLAFAFRAPSRLSPDYAPFLMLTAIYGGAVSSRANLAVRERGGESYGAHAAYMPMRRDGYLVLTTSVDESHVVSVLHQLFVETRRLQKRPISARELHLARALVREQQRARLDSSTDLAAAVSELYVYGLEPKAWRELDERIARVTAADIQQVARRYLANGSPAVVVGDLDVATRIERAGYRTVWGLDALPKR